MTFVAIKGERQIVLSSPVTEAAPGTDRSEQEIYLAGRVGPGILRSRLSPLLPKWLKRVVKRVLWSG